MDFISGSLVKKSYIRPNKLFTADKRTFISHSGNISLGKIKEVIDTIDKVLNATF